MRERLGRTAAVVLATGALVSAVLVAPGVSAAPVAGPKAASIPALSGPQTEYVVLAKDGVNQATVAKAIKAAGGQLVKASVARGSYLAKAPKNGFIGRTVTQPALIGAAQNRPIGTAPKSAPVVPKQNEEQVTGADRGTAPKPAAARKGANTPDPDPLAIRQWDMAQIGATPTGSYGKQPGKKNVLVGVIDTGVDGSHPDIAANFDRKRSRNFTTDIPLVDGPCEYQGCVDPPDVDGGGHGTHVASEIAAPLNGKGVAGVAPNVSLVNLRAGQDSGSFFLGSVMDALFTAGDMGIDVVNMSFYVDPYWMNCASNPADPPERQVEQRTIRTGVERALGYATSKGVTLVNSEGNEETDLGNPTSDTGSPNFPPGSAYDRTVDNSCVLLPAEGKGVIAVSSTGPSLKLAFYSNYGTEQTDISAPGGDIYDVPGGGRDISRAVLGAYPESIALQTGEISEPGGVPKVTSVIRECQDGKCYYYKYMQGTSMASPHAAGVAALVISKYGTSNGSGGFGMDPKEVEKKLYGTASKKGCPTSDTRCQGPVGKNGFFGHGIANANAAVS